ncbi:Arc family DNA-binding protein [Adlercreutzia sp. ZJ138]|uniref:Arc family DNA-binding protein n=1 Tax=Adlercreutzia sp. ZJ138 TaxID=2709405 RepID=UPI0013E9AD14|nr:Arc family DNA-binding protein [Adlercreutzia sp. ZJ138]
MTNSREEKVLDAGSAELVSAEENRRHGPADARARVMNDAKRGYRKRASADDSVMVSFRIPRELKARVKEEADANGRSQSEQMINSIEDGLSLGNAVEAVRECLSKFPPPFAAVGWEPSSNECMSFILEAVDNAIRRRESQLGEEQA